MTSSKSITILAHWKGQRRPVVIKTNDDIKTIERSIANVYQLRQISHVAEHQIQFYNTDYQAFIDLCPDTLPLFQQLLLRLASPEAPPTYDKTWILDIISRTVEPLGQRLDMLIPDDTYYYQQDNDTPESSINEERPLLTHSQRIGSEPRLLRSNSRRSSTNAFSKSIFHHGLDSAAQQQLNTTEHPLDLTFDAVLASLQRTQFKSDMFRKTSSKISASGVLLRAAPKANVASSDDEPYPIVHFNIPTDQLPHEWFIYIYILTESDQHGAYYLHASKGIFNPKKIPHSTDNVHDGALDNPYIVRLSQNDIRDGKYEMYIKVCNIPGVCSRRKEQLRQFPSLHDLISPTANVVLSTRTSRDLQFSSEKYHVGCILVCQDKVRDRCVSNLTVSARKRNDTDKTSEEDHEGVAKKQRIT